MIPADCLIVSLRINCIGITTSCSPDVIVMSDAVEHATVTGGVVVVMVTVM